MMNSFVSALVPDGEPDKRGEDRVRGESSER